LSARTLSEHASKALLAQYGVPLAAERLVANADEARAAARELGFPVVLKLCGDAIAHKTERDLVRLGLRDGDAVASAAAELLAKARPEDGAVGLLVAEQVRGTRELIAGLVRDPQFGACVMLGVGGVLAEALRDVVFAAVPLDLAGARALPDRLATRALLGPFRGEPAIDRDALARVLVGLSRLTQERPDVASVDLNPLIVRGGVPLAVDALVELGVGAAAPPSAPLRISDADVLDRFRPLFHPRGIIVAGASTHPGKFGFVTLHNLRRFGYAGELFGVNRDGEAVLGQPSFRSIDEIPDGAADLVFVCTPNQANVDLLRACAKKGVRAAFVASGGYGEAGEGGRALERELVSVADSLGILLAGPNGQGVISTPVSMCAQIVAPYPPPGRISVASQSGNLVSSFLNYAVASGVGISKAISCGNSAQTTLADYLDYFAADPETAVALAYLEGVADGAHFVESLRAFTARKPLVLVKGGVAAEGKRAAASHTGSLASDDRVFDGICAQYGALRAPSVEEAYEWAATFATQPLPRGRRTVVFTTAGGWGVLAADACAAAGLELVALPAEIKQKIDALGARALEPQQPDRPRGRRDARHDSRGARHRLPTPRRRRGDPPGHRHPGRQRLRVEVGRVLPRVRARAHRRLSRAPGPPLCAGGARGVGAPRQARPHRDRARELRSPLRQQRPARRARGGPALLCERPPRRARAACARRLRGIPEEPRCVIADNFSCCSRPCSPSAVPGRHPRRRRWVRSRRARTSPTACRASRPTTTTAPSRTGSRAARAGRPCETQCCHCRARRSSRNDAATCTPSRAA
jgi:acyl-CoA synthetase (NDP forming)